MTTTDRRGSNSWRQVFPTTNYLAPDRLDLGARFGCGSARFSGQYSSQLYSKENMSFQRIVLCSAALLYVSTDAFSISASTKLQTVTRSTVQLRSPTPRRSEFSLSMQAGSDSMDRRSVIAAAAALFASVASPLKSANAAGLAFGYGANADDINAQLLAYSLPPIDKVVGTLTQSCPSSSNTAVCQLFMPNLNVRNNCRSLEASSRSFRPLAGR